MEIRELATLGWKHAVSAFAEELYMKAGIDLTRPVTFQGLVTERCNAKCQYCIWWQLPEYPEDISIAQWQAALFSVKEFVGEFSINFGGGEPLIKPGFIDLLGWCRDNHIKAGFTTNGSALTRANVERIVAAHPFNVNISVDAPTAEVHDVLRGTPGLFEKLSKGIDYLLDARKRQDASFPIIVKPTVNSVNFRYLPDLVKWAVRMGDLCVNFQPMYLWAPGAHALWIQEQELVELEEVIEQLVAMRRNGAPIVTPENVLRMMPDHFRDKQAPRSFLPCRVGMRDFFIYSNGDVKSCPYFPVMGNINQQSAREIWYGAKAREIRKGTLACEKLCLATCVSQKTLGNKVYMALKMLKNARPRRSAKPASALKSSRAFQ